MDDVKLQDQQPLLGSPPKSKEEERRERPTAVVRTNLFLSGLVGGMLNGYMAVGPDLVRICIDAPSMHTEFVLSNVLIFIFSAIRSHSSLQITTFAGRSRCRSMLRSRSLAIPLCLLAPFTSIRGTCQCIFGRW